MKIIKEEETRIARKDHKCFVCSNTIHRGSEYKLYNRVKFCGDECKVKYLVTTNGIRDKVILFLGTLVNKVSSFSLFVCEKEGRCFLKRGRPYSKRTIKIIPHSLDSEGFFWVNGVIYPISSLSSDNITLKNGLNKISIDKIVFSVRL